LSAQARISLRTAWYAVVFLAALLPMLLLFPWVASRARSLMIEAALDMQVEEIGRIKDDIEHEMDNLVVLLHSESHAAAHVFEDASAGRGLDTERLRRGLGSIFGLTRSLHSVSVLDAGGRIVAHADNPAMGGDEGPGDNPVFVSRPARSDPGFVVPMHGRTYFGAPYRHQNCGMHFQIAVPVGPVGAPSGVLTAATEIAWFWKVVQLKVRQSNVLVYLVDSRGALLNASKNVDLPEGRLLTHLDIVRRLIAGKGWKTATAYTGLEGKRVYGAAAFIDDLGWGVVSEVPAASITGPIMKTIAPVAAAGVFTFVVCAALGIWLVGRVLRPIGGLSAAFEGVSGGDYSSKAPASTVREIDTLARGFNSMVSEINRREEEIRNSEERFRQIAENIRAAFWMMDSRAEKVIYASPTYEEIWGRPVEELYDDPLVWIDSVHEDDRERVARAFASTGDGEFDEEYRIVKPDGVVRWVSNRAFPVRDARGEVYRVAGFARDVTERKDAEAALKNEVEERRRAQDLTHRALREKEVLLREIHHRVKNNLQIISSMLRLQSGRAGDREPVEILRESQDRIRSMAMIHEKLYMSADLASIDFSDYVRGLATSLHRSYSRSAVAVALRVEVGEIKMDVDRAIQLGLILNELVSNALKHAFPGGMKGDILIEVGGDGTGMGYLSVRDNGVGLSEDLDVSGLSTLGLKLVTTLTEQIGGSMEIERDGGSTFRIVFPVVDRETGEG